MKKSLAQIGYEAVQNFGPWETAPDLVKSVHRTLALAIEKEIYVRIAEKFSIFWTEMNMVDPDLTQEEFEGVFPNREEDE